MAETDCWGLVNGVWLKVVADVDTKVTVAHPGGGTKAELVAGTTVARPDGGMLAEIGCRNYGCSSRRWSTGGVWLPELRLLTLVVETKTKEPLRVLPGRGFYLKSKG
ncbi:hypothetical protein MLD38_028972 [Melastoma candidum]|uniref:Uncharacterized protein n=1 Tax=Melastoma candidum TaxID=119954 RepID=A0ACB9N2N4_9MYRT|nr:hypothetical protein MLD38_028972 [Melastoma candidum]